MTYHGPGQIVGYPIVNLKVSSGFVAKYVGVLQEVVISALKSLGVKDLGHRPGCPGVWFEPTGNKPRKVCAIGVRISKGRTMHGFALNHDVDLSRYDQIVACGLKDLGVTSLANEGYQLDHQELIEALTDSFARHFSFEKVDLAKAVTGSFIPKVTRRKTTIERKPPWIRTRANMGEDYRVLKSKLRGLSLVTVCEEAGCPNIYECWSQGTATFMINGERCSRACGFCLVDTRKPLPLDPGEPDRVAQAVYDMGLEHCVVTAVARDDLRDGGASGYVKTVEAIRRLSRSTKIELLIPDCKGDQQSLDQIFTVEPDILNHNLETVLELQSRVRPSASYHRSLGVLARAHRAGLITKSGIMVGLGENLDQVTRALYDLRAVGVQILTIGQYLRPSMNHLPVDRWWTPAEFDDLCDIAKGLGFGHVESSPLTRSSYHAKRALDSPQLSVDELLPVGPMRADA